MPHRPPRRHISFAPLSTVNPRERTRLLPNGGVGARRACSAISFAPGIERDEAAQLVALALHAQRAQRRERRRPRLADREARAGQFCHGIGDLVVRHAHRSVDAVAQTGPRER